ncbi:MAG: DUF1207 domain-containing protein [Gemmatimonadales bacterium]|nr:DUF1207 domain-containing protein [Gemmatimonadales bacterium]
MERWCYLRRPKVPDRAPWFNRSRVTVVIGLTTLMSLAGPVDAAQSQVRWLPSVDRFELPVAAPRPISLAARLLRSSPTESQFGAEQEVEVTIGNSFSLLALGASRRPLTFGVVGQVSARFSLEDPRTALISHDWTGGIHGMWHRGPWRVTVELMHESSHLGDEYAERFSAGRLDWTREFVAIWVRRELGPVAIHLTGSQALASRPDVVGSAAGAAVDFRGDLGSWGGARVRPVLGVWWESHAFADWRLTTAGRAGLELDRDGQRFGLSVVGLTGVTPQRQFYNQPAEYLGIELRFDW